MQQPGKEREEVTRSDPHEAPRPQSPAIGLRAFVFTIGLKFVGVGLPYSIDRLLMETVATPDFDSRAIPDSIDRAELFLTLVASAGQPGMLLYFVIALTLVLVHERRTRISYETLSRTRQLTTRSYPGAVRIRGFSTRFLGEPLTILTCDRQFLRQSLAVHADELLTVAQYVDFDRGCDKNKVRVFKPLAERSEPEKPIR